MTNLTKRILSGVISCSLAFAFIGSYKANAENEKLAGDINVDGFVTSSDYPKMISYFTNQIEFDEAAFINADMNEDGKLNIVDVVMLKELLLSTNIPEVITTVTTTTPEPTTTVTTITTPEPTTTVITTTTPESITTVTTTTTPEPTTTATTTTTPEPTTTVTTITTPEPTATVTTTTTTIPDISEEKLQFLNKVNEFRAANNMEPMEAHAKACVAADDRAAQLATSLGGNLPEIKRFLYNYKIFPFCISQYTNNSFSTWDDMYSSYISQVRAALLNKDYDRLGIGHYVNESGRHYWVVLTFG